MKRHQQIRIISLHTVCVLYLLCNTLIAQSHNYRFKHYSPQDGLSHVTIETLFTDSFGFLWIGTTDGLNRYDGHTFNVFKNEVGNPLSIGNNTIYAIAEDANHDLLIGTRRGLYHYNRDQSVFHRMVNVPLDMISSISAQSDQSLLIGGPSGLYSYSSGNGIKPIYDQPVGGIDTLNGDVWIVSGNELTNHSTGEIFTFDSHIVDTQSDKDDFLVLTKKGLYAYQNQTKTFDLYPVKKLPSKALSKLTKDTSGNVWVGSEDSGVFYIPKGSVEFAQIQHDQSNPHSIASNIIRSIHADQNNNLWIGTWGAGLNFYNTSNSFFTNYNHHPGDPHSLVHDFVQSIFKTSNNTLLIGTQSGISVQKPNSDTFENYLTNSAQSISNNYIKAIFEDSQNSIWIGTQEGLFLSDQSFSEFHFLPISNSDNDINLIHEDRKKGMWIGTWDGLFNYNRKTKVFTKMPIEAAILDLKEDKDGTFWIGTYNSGLVHFNPLDLSITQFLPDQANEASLPHERVWTVHIDSKGAIWAGTFGGGLCQMISAPEKKISRVTEEDGLSSNAIISIEEDELGYLWVAGNNGITRYHPVHQTFESFGVADGLQGIHFNATSFQDQKGKLYFGGSKGLCVFDPLAPIPERSISPRVTSFELFNKPVKVGENEILTSSIHTTKKIELSYTENIFSFGFSSFDFGNSSTEFAYRLKNFSDEWNIVGADRRYVTYTNILSGKYVFELSSINRLGKINPTADTIDITILTPWWQAWWFKLTIAIVVLTLFVLIYLIRTRNIRKQNEELEAQVKTRTKELELSKHQVEEDKKIIEKSLLERESLLKEIHHRVKNNLQIIASLLYLQSGKFEDEDFKKVLEEGQGRVRSMALIHQKLYENEDLKSIPFGEYLQELVGEIRASFGMGNIQLNIEAENIHFDVDTAVPLGLIVNEMATNAFKYAFKKEGKGSISIFLTEVDGEYILNIKDDGKGIPEEIDIRKTKSLGLRLVRMLSQQLEGDFEFKSDNGTSFELKFAA